MDVADATPEHFFLQYILSVSSVTELQLRAQFAEINAKLPPTCQRSLAQVTREAERVLLPIGIEFRRFRDLNFSDGEYGYTLVANEPLSESLNKAVMSPTHAAQLKEMVDLMFQDSRCEGLSVRSLPIAKFPAKHEIVERMLAASKFVSLDSGRLFVSTGFATEIAEYLKQFLNKTLFPCAGCSEWLLHGRLCSDPNCTFRLHKQCYQLYFTSKGLPEGKCPECGSNIEN